MGAGTNVNQAVAAAKLEMAKRLLRAGTFIEQYHANKVSTPAVKVGKTYVVSSKPGEYPRLRTKHGRAGITKDATTPAEVIANGMRIRLGQSQATWYMGYLEAFKSRLGWEATAKALKALVSALITGKAP